MLQKTEEEELTPGTRLAGRYVIEKKLGSGANATVYLAHDKLFPLSAISIKKLHLSLAGVEAPRKRLIREVELNRRVSNPHVARIYDLGLTPQHVPFYTMEYLSGGSLSELVGNELPLSQGISILAQLTDGLSALHRAGICHNDLTPSNVLFDAKSQLRIIDLSAADEPSRSPFAPVNAPGTIAYISPERWRDMPTDERSDIYSFGVVAYLLLCGELPFSGKTPSEVMWRVLETAIIPLRAHRSEIPPWLEELVLAALQKDPAKRISSCRELHSVLSLSQQTNVSNKAEVRVILREEIRPTVMVEAEEAIPSGMECFRGSAPGAMRSSTLVRNHRKMSITVIAAGLIALVVVVLIFKGGG